MRKRDGHFVSVPNVIIRYLSQIAVLLSASMAWAQFDTVINSPPTLVGDRAIIQSNAQLNVFDGGAIGDFFHAGEPGGLSDNVEVQVYGGTVGDSFTAHRGSRVMISGGVIGDRFVANRGSQVTITGGKVGWQAAVRGEAKISGGSLNVLDAEADSRLVLSGGWIGNLHGRDASHVTISGGSVDDVAVDSQMSVAGGTFGDGFRTGRGAQLIVYGTEFRLDDILIVNLDDAGQTLALDLPRDGLLSGVLKDGTPFAFSRLDGDVIRDGTLTLEAVNVHPIQPERINTSGVFTSLGIRAGQMLVVEDGGAVSDNFNAGWGSTIIVEEGGVVGLNLEAVGAELKITGGAVGDHFDAFTGSRVTITDGSLGNRAAAFSGSQVTVSGGVVGETFDAFRGSNVTIAGGTVERGFNIHDGSQVQISGGIVDDLHAHPNSQVTISGGSLGDGFFANFDSQLTISGREFRVDGILIEGLDNTGDTVSLSPLGSLLSGVLADGTPFAFQFSDGDTIANRLNLEVSPPLPVGPSRITASRDSIPSGIRQGQTLVVDAGGVVLDHFNAGSESTVVVEEGGVVGRNLEAVGAEVKINGGTVGDDLDAFAGSRVTITGGSVGPGLDAHGDSQVTIAGGELRGGLKAYRESQVIITGGTVGHFSAYPDSHITIAGGSIGDGFRSNGSQIHISGAEFRLDGEVVRELDDVGQTISIALPLGAVLSGVLTDGTPFAFSSFNEDRFEGGTLTLESNALPPIGPSQIKASRDPVPLGIRQGQTLVVDDGGVVRENFNAHWGSAVIVEEGGVVGKNLEAVGAEVNIRDGAVGDALDAFAGSRVTISGGSVGPRLEAFSGSQVVINGGTIGNGLRMHKGSQLEINGGVVGKGLEAGGQVNISGGQVGDGFRALDTSQVVISGGVIGDGFSVHDGSTIDLYGGSLADGFRNWGQMTIFGGGFRLDGVLLEDLNHIGDTVSFDMPEHALLSGTLSDGTPFGFSSHSSLQPDVIAPGTLTLKVSVLAPVEAPLITASRDRLPWGIRQGQTLVVDEGGVVGDNFNAGWDSTVVVEKGGMVGDNLEAVGAKVNISGGTVGDYFGATMGSRVTLTGGEVGSGFRAFADSQVMITGGVVQIDFAANSSRVTIANEALVENLHAWDDSHITITGGSVHDLYIGDSQVAIAGGSVGSIRAEEGSQMVISGGEFRVDGILIDDLTGKGNPVPFDLPADAVLSGVFADGTPFAFSSLDRDHVEAGTLTLESVVLPPSEPPLIIATKDDVPRGVRQGQTLVVDAGGKLRDFFNASWGSTVIVEEGGVVGRDLEAVGAEVKIFGGQVDDGFDAFGGSQVTISGGIVRGQIEAFANSDVAITGGMVGGFTAFTGSQVTITGGAVGSIRSNGGRVTITGGSAWRIDANDGGHVTFSGGSQHGGLYSYDGSQVTFSGGHQHDGFYAERGSQVTLSGGAINDEFWSRSGSQVNLLGREFLLGGVELEELLPGLPHVIVDRDVTLSGTFADGSTFHFDLNERRPDWGGDFFSPDATLTVTLVPESSCLAMAIAGILTVVLGFCDRRPSGH